MRAVAIETFRGMGVAQFVDLTVIGPHISLELLIVAITAILRDLHPDRRVLRRLDIVHGGHMAIGTYRGIEVAVFGDFLAVYGR